MEKRMAVPETPGIASTARNVHDRWSDDEALMLRDRAVTAALDGIVIVDMLAPDCPIVDANPAFERMTGYPLDEVIGFNCRFLQGPETDPGAVDEIRRILAAGAEGTVTLLNYRRDGTPFANQLHLAPVRDDADRITHFVGIQHDVTEREKMNRELRFQSELLDQATVAVVATDPNGVVTHWNRHAERLYGWRRADAIGRPITSLAVGPPHGDADGAIKDRPHRGAPWEGDVECHRNDGAPAFVHLISSPVFDTRDHLTGIVGISVDISERRALEERLTRLAYRDSLTGLSNRTSFLERLQAAIDSPAPAAVLLFDLDRFKTVNDSLGHAAGDELLRQTAQRLQAELRSSDTVARLGGDEFAALVTGVQNIDDAGGLASRILLSLERPFVIGSSEAVVSGSVGIALLSPDSDGVETLLRAADIALYEAKRAGRGRWVGFDEALGSRSGRRLQLENDLRHAIERGELLLEYQPVVDLSSGSLHGFEALVRWRHPTLGLLQPTDFTQVAEETGLIVPLGEWVLGEACRQGTAWLALRPALPLVMYINISPRQLIGQALGHVLWRVLGETGLPPDHLTLEVTEQALAEDYEATTAFLTSIKSLGVRLALDDFGVGYSSLGRLNLLPLDELKLDRSFIRRLEDKPHATAFVGAVIELGHELALTVTAEGIETAGQRRLLAELGCDRGQGFWFSHPLSAADASSFVLNPSLLATSSRSGTG